MKINHIHLPRKSELTTVSNHIPLGLDLSPQPRVEPDLVEERPVDITKLPPGFATIVSRIALECLERDLWRELEKRSQGE